MKTTLKSLLNLLSNNNNISFEVVFWDGEIIRVGPSNPEFILKFVTKNAAKRTINAGVLGFGEEYMAGNITIEGNFRQLLRLGVDDYFQNLKPSLLTKLNTYLIYIGSLNTIRKSPKNISYHYDRGNDFYKLWLDESMTYSCAYYKNKNDTLETAQSQKYEHICRKLLLKENDTLVDIGCGWGGMLIYAAKKYLIRGVGCTLSEPQYEYANKKINEMGLADRVQVLLQDYRNVTGKYDKFVSIGMFEHVGKKFMPLFMEKAKSLLKLGGAGLLHTIGKERQAPTNAWTRKYIFPGGYVPALDEIIRAMGNTGLVPLDVENLRVHYAKTLDEWSKRYEANVDTIRKKFDEKFVRMWRFFLNGSSAGFLYGDTRLFQILFSNGINNDMPLTRDHIYK